MKLRLLFLFIFAAVFQLNGQMLISGVIDGDIPGGLPKAVEFYVYEDIPNLAIFGFGSANNGGGTDNQEFTFPSISVTSGTFLYVASESIQFNNFFGFNPNYTNNAASINGDDAIELFKSGVVFDVFGNISNTSGGWAHSNGWVYRNNNTGPDASSFILSNWSINPNALSNETTNSTASNPFPIGTFTYGPATIPDPPVATAATDITHESFLANWNASSGATNYILDVSELEDFSTLLSGYGNLEVGGVTTYSVTGLNVSEDYFYRVRAYNSVGLSANSNIISVSTTALPNTVVQFISTSGSVLENSGTYYTNLSITYPSLTAATTIEVLLFGGTGDAADIDNYITQQVTFPAGSSSDQQLTLTISDDGVIEGNENLIFKLQNPSGGNTATVGTNSQFELTIIEAASGNYYDGIDPNFSTFVDDLKNRIRNPYTWVPYSQYDETNVANFSSIDNGDGTRSVFCVYSNYEFIYSGSFAWTLFSREHTFPHSWMPTNPANDPIERDEYADQHHLFPTHQDGANGIRSNHPLGNVSNVQDTFGDAKFGTDASGNIVYEPRDEHKGDAARAILYMMIRYDDIDGYDWGLSAINSASSQDPQDLNVLLDWHNQDPPSSWEIARNDYTQSIQGNRNPFVDHPEYVNYIDFYSIEYLSNSLFFSEYVEGSSDNKALEIFNNTGASIDLSLSGYKIEVYSNGNITPSYSQLLNGTIADGDVFVIVNPSAGASLLSLADQTSGSVNFNGNDAIALVRGAEIVDVIGQIGFDPGEEWGADNVSTANNTIRRKTSIGIGDADGSNEFDPEVEWNGFAEDTFDGLGSHIVNDGPPTIANVTRTPKIPTSTENSVISAEITDDISVKSAILKYNVNGGTDEELVMNISSGSTFEAIIPSLAYTDGSILAYRIYAEDEDGALSISSEQKVFTGTTQIANLNVLDDIDKRLVHVDAYARIAGVATVESGTFSPTSLDIYIQDATAGINIFKGNNITTITRGYIYIVEGKLEQFYGKAELVPDDLSTDIIDGGITSVPKIELNKVNDQGVLPDPIVLTIAEFLSSPETYEGMLIGIQHLSPTGGSDAWPAEGSNANYEVTDNGGSSKLLIRIDKDTEIDGTSEPTWPKDLVGIFTQFDVAAPYTWGYQIQPRDLNDIQNDGALPVELMTFSALVFENNVSLSWETATEVNNYGFEVERHASTSLSMKNNFILSGDEGWETVAFIAGSGNSNSNKSYNYSDNSISVSGKYSYRLKQIDIDGKYEYSNTIEVEVGVPTKFEVVQNFPNPFNPSTTISFSIPEKSEVNVQIFNMLGQSVYTLVNEELNAGKYSYNFEASHLSSGNYIYRVTAGKNVEIRKMILLK